MSPLRSFQWSWLPIGLGAIAAVLLPLPGQAEPAPEACAPPHAGRHVVMERGWLQQAGAQQPVARLLQERWNPDGTIVGTGFVRTGRNFRRFDYSGSYRPIGPCRWRLDRRPLAAELVDSQPITNLDAGVVLDAFGRPRYSLALVSGATITGIWRQQISAACTQTTLSGTVVSQQFGFSWGPSGWRPNGVLQRETWTDGGVRGLALSSDAGRFQEASYTGTIEVGADCLATVVQQDSEGVEYRYRAVVMADGSGYVYLQDDADDLTIGWLDQLNGP